MSWVLLGCLLAMVVAWCVFRPLFEGGDTNAGMRASDRVVNLQDQKERCVQVLKDLEMDFSTGKIDQDDYDRTRLQLSTQLADILTALEKTSDK